jgi:hypothetical protein
MDAPLLGAQNRVILAGVLSPFRSKAGVVSIQQIKGSGTTLTQSHTTEAPPVRQHRPCEPSRSCYSSTDKASSKTNYSQPDPLFNPPFANDVLIQNRSWWENVQHFARKHKDEGFVSASFNHWVDHFEFGSCLLNSKRLKEQYHALRRLDHTPTKAANAGVHARVRFVQFYTASYKGRAGKRYIEKTYIKGSQCPETDEQSVLIDEEEQSTEDPQKVTYTADLEELHFCKLARQKDGEVDPLWKKIMMATNDEVNAHTILFMPGPHYDDLVERTCNEITDWVSDRNP